MYNALASLLKKPPLYTKTAAPFWDDEHISMQMLKAHLDPDFEGASRKLQFIDRSAAWISEILPPAEYPELIDFGCGPGLYAERFSQAGYRVTGVDFSKRSIAYAVGSAAEKGLDIRYLCQNYLEFSSPETVALATMIYCDYGALSTADRKRLLDTVYRCLKPGGRFLFDVFSMASYGRFEESETWERCENGGFWTEKPHIALHGRYRYPENATLEQTCTISDAETSTYYLWNTYFSKKTLINEVLDAGFKVCGLFDDVAGGNTAHNPLTIAILLEK